MPKQQKGGHIMYVGVPNQSYAGHLIGCGKNGKLCVNFQQYYAEESDDYAEKMPDMRKFLK